MRQSREPLPAKLVVELLGAVLSAGVFALVSYLIGGRLKPVETVAISAAALIVSIIFLRVGLLYLWRLLVERVLEPRIRARLQQEESDRMAQEVREIVSGELASVTGIVEIFPSFRHCEEEILDALPKSNSVRIFLQIGRTVLAGSTSFYDRLGDSVNPVGEVRILHAGAESPYLSERVAFQRDSKFHVWQADLDHAVKKVEALSSSRPGSVEARQHREGYVWRLFITDEYAYVQPYLFDRDNSEQAPVLKISRFIGGKDNLRSLYRVFVSYFDQKWEENTPQADQLEGIIPEGSSCAVAGVIRYHQFYLFAIPKRYIARAGRDLPFHGVGGKVRKGEGYTDALRREAAEELGAQLVIEPASRTRFFTTNAQLSPLALSDVPRPWCIYKRSRETDPNFEHVEVLWLVAYEAKLKADSLEHLRPGAEVGALVILTGDLLRRTTHDVVTYRSIGQSGDGSRVIWAEGVEIDQSQSRRAVPAGVAALVAAEQTPRILHRL